MDCLVIGAGIIGISIAKSFLDEYPTAKVLIVDKETSLGYHASGRNSGVIHAGFYYSPDSLKATFCREGNRELKKIIKQHNIPIKNSGKVIVTKNYQQVRNLEILFDKGIKNQVDIELLPESELSKFEPLANTCEKFIWSPTTSVSNPQMVLKAIAEDFIKLGGKIELGANVTVGKNQGFYINGSPVDAQYVFNASGVNSIHIAHSLGLAVDYTLLPVMGLYKKIPEDFLPLNTLVYPVPSSTNPFLGVHLTLTTDNFIKLGPTAIPVLGREQYDLFNKIDLLDVKNSKNAIQAMLKHSISNTSKLALTEALKLYDPYLIKKGAELINKMPRKTKWQRVSPGIRAQLVNLQTGKFVDDFMVFKDENTVHVLNAVSPGWTAAIPFANWIVRNLNNGIF